MHILKTSLKGNTNIGLYGFANDHFALVGLEFSPSQAEEFSKVLGVPVHRISIAGTSLVGVFVTGNNHKIILPNLVFDDELRKLKHLGIEFEIINTHLTALGNNILCNDHGALVNPEFSRKDQQAIQKALGVPVHPATIADLEIVGSCAALNNKGCIVHRHITNSELAEVNKVLHLPVEPSTVNLGSPYIRSGIITNSKGFIIGDQSGGPEVTFADECLGFLK